MGIIRYVVTAALREAGYERRIEVAETAARYSVGLQLRNAANGALSLLESKWVRLGVGVGVVAVGCGFYCFRRRAPICRPKRLSDDDGLLCPGVRAPEAMVNSTAFHKGIPPPCQVAVLRRDGDIYSDVGGGVRLDAHLVVPDHVYGSAARDGIVYLCGAGKFLEGKGNVVAIGVDRFQPIGPVADVSAAELTIDEWSVIGARAAKVSGGPRKGTTDRATICDNSGARSLGEVMMEDTLTIQYNGNTRGGFSGCLYMIGNVAVGLHLNGIQGSRPINEGIPVAALEALLHPIKYRAESKGGGGYPRELKDFDPEQEDFRVMDDGVLFRNAKGKYRYYHDVPVEVIKAMEDKRFRAREEEDFLPQRWDDEQARQAYEELEARRGPVCHQIGNQGEALGRLLALAGSLPTQNPRPSRVSRSRTKKPVMAAGPSSRRSRTESNSRGRLRTLQASVKPSTVLSRTLDYLGWA